MKTIILLACPLILAVPAVAQETRASAAAKFNREFAQSDANGDGQLTRAEVQARIGKMKAGAKPMDATHAKRLTDLWFDTADRDKSGKVSPLEAQALLSATFRRYDANGDGRIGAGETAAAKSGAPRGR